MGDACPIISAKIKLDKKQNDRAHAIALDSRIATSIPTSLGSIAAHSEEVASFILLKEET